MNRLNREIFQLALDAGEDYDTREWAMSMTMVARAFERIGDNAVDIGEQVAFIESGLFREFGAKNRMEGTSFFLSLSVPLRIRMPSAPPPAP